MCSDAPGRLRSASGNTLLLMPVAVLVLLLLAAIAVDAAVLFLGQRRLADLAASVARDAVAAVDRDHYYEGELVLDERLAGDRGATLTGALPRDDALLDPSCTVTTGRRGDGPTASVDCTARVRFVFAPAVPGARRLSDVAASETAVGLSDG